MPERRTVVALAVVAALAAMIIPEPFGLGLVAGGGVVLILLNVTRQHNLRREVELLQQKITDDLRQNVERTEMAISNLTQAIESKSSTSDLTTLQETVKAFEGSFSDLYGMLKSIEQLMQEMWQSMHAVEIRLQETRQTLQSDSQRLQETRKALQSVEERLKGTRQRLQLMDEQLKITRTELDSRLSDEARRTTAALRRERAERIASFAQRDSRRVLPERILILLTVQRTGSTWFVDMLRCHPHLEFDPSVVIFEQLGLKGGRYPRGLANGPDAVMDLENTPGLGARVPVFRVSDVDLPVASQQPFALEKVHPEFFQDDALAFIERLRQLENEYGTQFEFVCQVRDPKAVLASFWNYKQRDPEWYAHLDEAALPDFVLRAFRAIAEFAEHYPCLIVDYNELKQAPEAILVKVLRRLWPVEDTQVLSHLADLAVEKTRREVRLDKANTGFLGAREGLDAEFNFEAYADTIAMTYEAYETILARRDRGQL